MGSRKSFGISNLSYREARRSTPKFWLKSRIGRTDLLEDFLYFLIISTLIKYLNLFINSNWYQGNRVNLSIVMSQKIMPLSRIR